MTRSGLDDLAERWSASVDATMARLNVRNELNNLLDYCRNQAEAARLEAVALPESQNREAWARNGLFIKRATAVRLTIEAHTEWENATR